MVPFTDDITAVPDAPQTDLRLFRPETSHVALGLAGVVGFKSPYKIGSRSAEAVQATAYARPHNPGRTYCILALVQGLGLSLKRLGQVGKLAEHVRKRPEAGSVPGDPGVGRDAVPAEGALAHYQGASRPGGGECLLPCA